MKTKRIVFIIIAVIVVAATAAMWAVFFSSNIADAEAKGIMIHLLDLQIFGCALTVVFELDILFGVLYFTSEKSKRTTAKTVINIICAVAASLYTLVILCASEVLGISMSFIYGESIAAYIAWMIMFIAVVASPIVIVALRIAYVVLSLKNRKKVK